MSQLPPPPDDAARGGGAPSDPAGGYGGPSGQWGTAGGNDAAWSQQPAGGPPAGYRRGLSPSQERTWGMATHLSALVMFLGLPSLLGPLVVWLIKKDESPFVDDQGKESLNFNLSVFLYSILGGILMVVIGIVTLGLGLIVLAPVALVAAIAWLVLTVVAAVRAADGQAYRYPLTIRFIK